MADAKLSPNTLSVNDFLNGILPESKRSDCFALVQMMQDLSGAQAVMWGDSIIGFGDYHYTYKSGRKGHYFVCGFSPRKANICIYILGDFAEYEEQLSQLGKHKAGRGCLYINKLSDIRTEVLHSLLKEAQTARPENH